MQFEIDSNLAVRIANGGDIVAPEVYEAPTIIKDSIPRGFWIKDPTHHEVDKVKDLKFYMGYEGALIRVWMNPETEEVMISTRKIADARNARFNHSKTFGEMADEILPDKEVLFNDKDIVRYMIFVDSYLFQATKAQHPKCYAVHLYSMKKDGKIWKLIAEGNKAPKQSRYLFPTEEDFNGNHKRVISRRQLTLEEANYVLKNAAGNHTHVEIGEFVFAETSDHRHIRINSETYQWRRDVVGDGGNVRVQLEKVLAQVKEVNGKYPLPVTILNFGVPKRECGEIIPEKKEWEDMNEEETELAVMYIFANCLPRSGYKFVMKMIGNKLSK